MRRERQRHVRRRRWDAVLDPDRGLWRQLGRPSVHVRLALSSRPPRPDDVDGWLAGFELEPVERAERDGVTSWDLIVDARRRHDVRLTLILDPALALVAWVHYAPPLNDTFRVSYRQFLRWNDELPFMKFALSEDDRPVLTSEVPADRLDEDAFGLTIARLLAVCDLLLNDSIRWLWPGAKVAPAPQRASRHDGLLDRYADRLTEFTAPAEVDPDRSAEPRPESPADP